MWGHRKVFGTGDSWNYLNYEIILRPHPQYRWEVVGYKEGKQIFYGTFHTRASSEIFAEEQKHFIFSRDFSRKIAEEKINKRNGSW
jgi:hypothetical protein